MTLPANVTTGKITGHFSKSDGSPEVGTVTFTPTVAYVHADDGSTITTEAKVCVLDANGDFTTPDLIATDNASLNPTEWTYAVLVRLSNLQDYYHVSIPSGSTQTLSAISPIAGSTGSATTKGDKGDQGPVGPAGVDGSLPSVGPRPVFYDDFHRGAQNLNASLSQSGHSYVISGPTDEVRIADNRLHFDVAGTGGVVRIANVRIENLDSIAGEFTFTAGETDGNNLVIGCSDSGFGNGSIQVYVNPVSHWQLFCVQHPIIDPYPVLASGDMAMPIVRDGQTRYKIGLRRIATDTVALDLPDGSVEVVQHDFIATYWGDLAGFQERRPNETDGIGEFTKVAANGIPSASAPAVTLPALPYGAELYFDGQGATDFTTPAPAWTPGDMEIVAKITPKTYASGAIQTIVSQWATNEESFFFAVTATGKLQYGITLTGLPPTLPSTSTDPLPVVDGETIWVRLRYRASDGQTTYDTAPDGLTWTQLGNPTFIGSGGAPFPSNAPMEIGSRAKLLMYAGRIGYVAVHDGFDGPVVAGVDFTQQWRNAGITGELWTPSGPGVGWTFVAAP